MGTAPDGVSVRGVVSGATSSVRLVELGPRMSLKLVKIEEGLFDGEILHHEFVGKTEEEKKEMRERREKRKREKEKLKKEQEKNGRKRTRRSRRRVRRLQSSRESRGSLVLMLETHLMMMMLRTMNRRSERSQTRIYSPRNQDPKHLMAERDSNP